MNFDEPSKPFKPFFICVMAIKNIFRNSEMLHMPQNIFTNAQGE